MRESRSARGFAIRSAMLAVLLGALVALAGCASTIQGIDEAVSSGAGGAAAAPAGRTSGYAASGVPATQESLDAKSVAIAPQPGGSGTDASKVPATEKLIVRNKTLRIEVGKVPDAVASIRALATKEGADITQLQVATSSDEPVYRPMAQDGTSPDSGPLQAYVVVRVPADRYAAFIEEAAKLGTVRYQAESTDDVTQQHIDLKARLDNLKAQEIRLRDFFAKAKNVTEMLQIENELARVRGDIESLSAQVAYLERQAAMATVTIELTEPKALVRPAGIDWGVGTAFTNSVRAFVGTLNVLIVLLGPALALGLFIVLPVVLIARALMRRSRKRAAARTADGSSEEPAGGETTG
jgi:ABC-type multidrug transport system fused ATPase/permease subunit